MNRKRLAILAIVVIVACLFTTIYLLVLVRPIQATPQQLALTQDDLPKGWTIKDSTTFFGNHTWANGTDYQVRSGGWWMTMTIQAGEGNVSVSLVIGSSNSSTEAHDLYLKQIDGYRYLGGVFETVAFGDEGVMVSNGHGGPYIYYFRDGNIVAMVVLGISSGTDAHPEPWSDDFVNIVANKINKYDIPIHV